MNARHCRLYVIVATEVPVAVVFCRKPSKWWHILKWNLAEPRLTRGAWFHGSLYPRCSNVSPDGQLLCYLAMKGGADAPWNQYWAVSKVPWLTALVAWENVGTWATGCRFRRDGGLTIAGTISKGRPFHGEYPGDVRLKGVDTNWQERQFSHAVERGWRRASQPDDWLSRLAGNQVACSSASAVLERENPNGSGWLALISQGGDPQERRTQEPKVEYLFSPGGGKATRLEDVIWADWEHTGRVLVATRSGSLEIREANKTGLQRVWCENLDGLTPSPSPAPRSASHW